MSRPRDPPWLDIARRYIGLTEIPGKQHQPVILRWLRELRAWWAEDETPWCGTFTAAVMREAGVELPRHWYRARAWLDWGVPLMDPAPGCVVVYERGGGGHVGLVVGRDPAGRWLTLGGNQGNRVSVAPFDPQRVLGFRWPHERLADLFNAGDLPLLASAGASSHNEA